MTLDILHFIEAKGGSPDEIRESQRKRGLSDEIVDEVAQMYADFVKLDYEASTLAKSANQVQKEIAVKKKEIDAQAEAKRKQAKEHEVALRVRASTVGNIVGKDVPVSNTEDDNKVLRTWHPMKKSGILAHHEVLLRLDAMDLDRGSKISGHRGYFLTNDGVDLNQALISYGLDFLRNKGYKKIQPPFFMNKDVMAKTAQLDQFDEELYKYLIATSEQPISSFHSDEWFESPRNSSRLSMPILNLFSEKKQDLLVEIVGIFRFCITEPEKSWEMFESMVASSEEFYQSLKIPYRVVAIVSSALNLAASQKYDLEAWFPFQGAHKELVSCSNCTDYQSRRLEVRCGLKSKDQARKVYVHMLNGTLCATERALCCIVENYQTPEGLVIPEPLRPYMQGRDFIPFVKALPKSLQKKQV
ncbi:serine-tRNA ligase [Thelephora terrestris]|uniref:Seryl-tRNA(Ser) synthetase n=1 Tax=Thelephora terrestris TaxID=56493 RepID=A0A9P6L0R9_9AGAM|nr:serine-tRNA ligase [Thelephora terrestris]